MDKMWKRQDGDSTQTSQMEDGRKKDMDKRWKKTRRNSNLSNGPILGARGPVIPQIPQFPVKIPIFDFATESYLR